MNNQLMEGVHGHDFDELVIVRNGSGFHIINDEVKFICQGDFFLLPLTTPTVMFPLTILLLLIS